MATFEQRYKPSDAHGRQRGGKSAGESRSASPRGPLGNAPRSLAGVVAQSARLADERRLVAQMKEGDGQALRAIYERYKDRLLTLAFSLLRDMDLAEDILHDVFVSFAAGIDRFQLHTSLKHYLSMAVVNRVRDQLRRKKVRQARAGQLVGDFERVDPQSQALRSEQLEVLTEALAQLPPDQREAIVLHLNTGLKFREIAAIQNVGVSTVQGRYRYGLKKLRAVLD